MKTFGIALLLSAIMAPVVSARLTLLRLSHGDQKLRGLSSALPKSTNDERKVIMRELLDFWADEASMSFSMYPPREPSPVEIPDLGFDFYSMSMSMPPSPTLPEDINSWWDIDLSHSYSMPLTPDVETEYSPGGAEDSVESTTEEDRDETAAENLGGPQISENPSSSSNLGAALLVILVVAAMAILSAWYVRKNQRASSNASMMTPLSNPMS